MRCIITSTTSYWRRLFMATHRLSICRNLHQNMFHITTESKNITTLKSHPTNHTHCASRRSPFPDAVGLVYHNIMISSIVPLHATCFFAPHHSQSTINSILHPAGTIINIGYCHAVGPSRVSGRSFLFLERAPVELSGTKK